MPSNLDQVVKEMEAFAAAKWLETATVIETWARDSVKVNIYTRATHDTNLMRENIDIEVKKSKSKVTVYAKEAMKPYPKRPSRDTVRVAHFQEEGTKTTTPAVWMFKDGSAAAWTEITGLLSGFWST